MIHAHVEVEKSIKSVVVKNEEMSGCYGIHMEEKEIWYHGKPIKNETRANDCFFGYHSRRTQG